MINIPTKAEFDQAKIDARAATAQVEAARVQAEANYFSIAVSAAMHQGLPAVTVHKEYISQAAELQLKHDYAKHNWFLAIDNTHGGCIISWMYKAPQ